MFLCGEILFNNYDDDDDSSANMSAYTNQFGLYQLFVYLYFTERERSEIKEDATSYNPIKRKRKSLNRFTILLIFRERLVGVI